MTDRIGQQLGNYRLIRLLGRGGFAEVYLSEHIHLGTDAAIKLLHTHLVGEDIEAFRKEARTIARLVHPNIVRIFDFGIEAEVPFLVMDYAPNGTVRKQHPKGVSLPLPMILKYVKQVADALQYAHDEHFIHRDIKPENLLIGRHQEVLLSDFGIALIAQTSRSQSMQDVAGTANYMAPEQFQGKPRPASDQYALAIMVYEWLTGTCPFHGSFTEIASQHLFVPPPPLQGRMPTVQPAVEQVVMTALAKDPHQRFNSVQAFALAFEQASQSEIVGTPSVGEPVQLTDAKHQIFPSPSLIEKITPPGPESVSHGQPTPASQRSSSVLAQPGSSPTIVPAATHQPSTLLNTDAPSVPSVLSPLSQTPPSVLARPGSLPIVESTQPASLPVTDVNDRPLPSQQKGNQAKARTELQTAQSQPTRIAEKQVSPLRIREASISRRAVLIGLGVVVVASGVVEIIRLASAQPTRLGTVNTLPTGSSSANVRPTSPPSPHFPYTYTGHSDKVSCVTWSPDGTRIASGSNDRTVQVWSPANGGQPLIYRGYHPERGYVGPDIDFIPSLAWSPDSTRIASLANQGGGAGGDTTVPVWSATDGSPVFTITYKDVNSSGYVHVMTSLAWSPDGKRIATGTDNNTVEIWNAADGSHVLSIVNNRGTAGLQSVVWSSDNTHIAVVNFDEIGIWDVINGSFILAVSLPKQTSQISDVKWSPDGVHIAAPMDVGVEIWNATNGNQTLTYTGQSDIVNSVAWSPNSKRIASGSNDRTVQVWNAADGSNIFTYTGHSSTVNSVAWSPKNIHIASGSDDNTVQVWQAPS